jgi:hypothetical protein
MRSAVNGVYVDSSSTVPANLSFGNVLFKNVWAMGEMPLRDLGLTVWRDIQIFLFVAELAYAVINDSGNNSCYCKKTIVALRLQLVTLVAGSNPVE